MGCFQNLKKKRAIIHRQRHSLKAYQFHTFYLGRLQLGCSAACLCLNLYLVCLLVRVYFVHGLWF